MASCSSKDLGIVRIRQGSQTPKQFILKGDKTVECFLWGEAELSVTRDSSDDSMYAYNDGSYGVDMVLGAGDKMQWSAIQDTVCCEICYPPYEDGRFQDQ